MMNNKELDLLEIKNQIWNSQIGENNTTGKDFSGRVINKDDYENYNSPYGWTLINFGNDEYLIVHLDSKKEFPENITEKEHEEFIVNDKIFSVNKNLTGEWDINLIEYKTADVNKDENTNKVKESTNKIEENTNKTEESKDILFESSNDLDIKDSEFHFNNLNDHLIKQQEKEINTLEIELNQLKDNEQKNVIEKNNQKLKDLKNEIQKMKEFSLLNNFNNIKKESNIDTTSYLKLDDDLRSNKNLDSTLIVQDNFLDSNSSESIIQKLTNKLNEQTIQLERLKLDDKINQMKLNNLNYLDKLNINPNTLNTGVNLYSIAIKQWEIQFGDKTFATDFANRIIFKDKFGSNIEGGWNIDYFDKDSTGVFVASSLTIAERSGKKKFVIDNVEYNIIKDNNKWEIVSSPLNGINFDYSIKKITNIASFMKPKNNNLFNGNYETYSSLLINLENFPLMHIGKFEDFLKNSLKDLSIFKNLFIYSNENLYRNNLSDISCYARVFFKTSSTKQELEVLMMSLTLKQGLLRFIENYWRISEKNAQVCFSMFLYNHQKRLKFVQAETNFELLKYHPIPMKIPKNSLILDGEYNSTLKFHENNLWRKLKPYYLDFKGNVYYICNIDIENMDIAFNKEKDNYYHYLEDNI